MKKNVFNFSLLLPLILNNSSLSQQIIILFFCVSAIIYGSFTISLFKIFLLVGIVFSFAINISNFEVKNGLRILQLIVGFIIFPLKIAPSDFNIKYIKIAILYIFCITVCDIMNLQFFFDFRDYFYPSDVDPWKLSFDHSLISLSNRYGSIFYNPNILGQIMLLIYIIYLLIIYDSKIKFGDLIFLVLNSFCILVSGSRTAFVIYGLITFYYFLNFYKNKVKYFLLIVGLPYLVSFLLQTRLLKLSNESGDSMDQKRQILIGYLESLSLSFNDILVLIFGTFKLDIQFDNDLGNIIYYLGFYGFVVVLFFYIYEFSISSKKFKYFFAFLMISYGATLLINFKFFIFTIIILSLLRSMTNETINTIK